MGPKESFLEGSLYAEHLVISKLISAVGGNPKVVIAIPEIRSFRLEPDECDFIVIGSDGIFDKLSNEEVAECVWMSVKDSEITIGTPE